MAAGVLTRTLAETIRREGPIRFDRFMEAALYDPQGGFFAVGGGAGRAGGDFITSPEVGSLFGAVVARALDAWWESLDRPDPYVVVDAGAGRGQLARDVLRAAPACAPALRYVMVERSATLRRLQHEHLEVEPPEDALGPAVRRGPDDDEPEPVPGTGPIVTQMETFPAFPFTGAIVANELLDNLPFRIVDRVDGGWIEIRVGFDGPGFIEVAVPAEPALCTAADEIFGATPLGARLPVPTGVLEWFGACSAALRRGYLAVVDYADAAAGLAERGPASWLRTYRGHERGGDPLVDPGSQDITSDVVVEAVLAAARREGFALERDESQAEWLSELGLDDLVAAGRGVWEARAHIGDLEALRGRSAVHEAEVLLHPAGLGAHRVLVFSKSVRTTSRSTRAGTHTRGGR